MKRRAPPHDQGNSAGPRKRRMYPTYRLPRSFTTSSSAEQSLPPQPEQQQQANEDVVMTDSFPNIPYRLSPYLNPNALQSLSTQRKQQHQANEDFVMTDSLPHIPHRPSPYLNPNRPLITQSSPFTSSNAADVTDPCCHNDKPVLWDDPYGPWVPKSLAPFRKPKTPIAPDLPPLHDIDEIFEVVVGRALDEGLEEPLRYFDGRSIRVATMCSGTESPLLALDLISKSLQKHHGMKLNIDHVFSAEIVPFKQAYIERNFHPKIIFRDMRELIGNTEATTAYGTKVPIPSNVDILVTGTSCVDFSKLNRWNKGLDDDGESGQTFFAFIDYIAQYRPAICILENVQTAPWDDIVAILTNDLSKASVKIRNAYKNIWNANDKAYAAEFAKIDTKKYYIPHTRQRGYLIAIDRRKYNEAGNAVKEWAQNMKRLQRQASSPAECSLINDETRLNEIQASAINRQKARNKLDWTLCCARNQKFRESISIGSQRPLTRWVNGGSCSGPDHWDLTWIRSQPERTWDGLDICHLRNAQRGFDDCYKTRIIEVTQSVDRDRDIHGHGVVSCLTPSGTKFITTQGRALTGREALRLQGIPVHNLTLTHETQRELFDLAGNAMTTTVVGTALLAALMAGHRAISMYDRPRLPENPLPTSFEDMNSEQLLPEQTIDLTEYERCTLDELLSEASASARLCLCEGKTLSRGRSFKKCQLCCHTACEKCAGLPRHDYYALPEFRRLKPSSFIKWLTKHLPMRVQLAKFDISHLEKLYGDCRSHLTSESKLDWTKYRAIVEQALGEDMHFQSVTRSQYWVVKYDASRSYLELVIGANPYWRFFAKPEPHWPNNSRRRWLVKHPIARMRLIPGNNLLAGEWEFHLPVFLQCSLKIEEFGPTTDSWESHLGIQMKSPAVEKVHTKLIVSAVGSPCDHIARSVKEVVGEYELLENCGTASRSLHRRISHPEGPRIYFFLDAENVGAAQDDRFVFSQDHHRLSLGEARNKIGSIDPRWRQGRTAAKGKDHLDTTECRLYGLWEACGAKLQVFESRPSLTYAVARRDLTIRISPSVTSTLTPGAGTWTCSADTMTFVSWKIPLMEPDDICWRLGHWRQIEQENEAPTLRNLTWLFQNSKDLDQFPSVWRRLSLPAELTRCQSCSPDVPSLKWRQVKGTKKTTVIPYEDERQAGVFERASKAKTRPFTMQTQLQTNVSGGFTGHLRVGINITALAHRVLSHIPTKAAGSVELSWRLNTMYEWPSEVKSPRFTLKSNKDDPEENFVFRKRRSNVELGSLRKEQRRSLWWMKQQESDVAPAFLEQEVEEAYLPTLGWLAETVAQFPSYARGGVLADEVGYGKTATTLALIQANPQKTSDLFKDTETAQEGIPSKATLIIVPGILMVQWESQIAKFLGPAYPVVKINSMKDLRTVNVRQITETSIVLLNWKVLESPSYHARLGIFAAMPTCASWNERPYKTWLEQAITRSDDHAEELRSCENVEEFTKIHEERLLSVSQNDDAAIPYKKPLTISLSLKPFQLTQEGKLQGMKCPPLSLFRFHRIVLDEYTYLQGLHVHSISSFRARYRWVLSGTPNMADFADVKLLAGLLNVNLGVDHDASTKLQKSSIAKIQNSRTAAEKFRSYVEQRSPQWHAHRDEHAQNFLDQFARRNTPELDEIEAVEILKPVVLSWMERALFLELQQKLHIQEIGSCRGNTDKIDGHRVKRMNEILRGSESLEEALVKACFPFIGDSSTNKSQNSLDSIIDLRETEYQLVCDELKKNFYHILWLQRQLNQLQLDGTQISLCLGWKHGPEDCDPEGSADLDELLAEAKETYMFDHQDEYKGGEPSEQEVVKEMQGDVATKVDKEAQEKDRAAFQNPWRTSLGSRELMNSGQVQNPCSYGPESGALTDDDETISEFSTYIDEETGSPLAPVELRLSDTDLEDEAAINRTAKNITTHVRKLSKELLSRRRALRFLHTAQAFHLWQGEVGPPPTCLSCCEVAEDPSCTFVLGSCGHVACQKCLEERRRVEGCVLDGCSSAVSSEHIHPADCFRTRNQENESHGTKLDSVVSCIREVAKEDQVLLFVQFQTILKAVCTALQASGISFYAIGDGGIDGAVKMIRDFQENESESKKQVLILNPSNETAAGLNLVNANHVIFLSPFLSETAHEFHKSRIQCIGRARRYGQTKKVHVYDFLALNTIDVDITEDQQCKHLVQESLEDGEEVWKLKSEQDMTDDEKMKTWRSGWERKKFSE